MGAAAEGQQLRGMETVGRTLAWNHGKSSEQNAESHCGSRNRGRGETKGLRETGLR